MKPIQAKAWKPLEPQEDLITSCESGMYEVRISGFGVGNSPHEGHPDEHDDLSHDAPGRYYVHVPGEGSLVLSWKIEGWEHVTAADIHIYPHGDDRPIGMVEVKKGEDHHDTQGRLSGVRSSDEFPDGVFTFEKGPYLARLRILSVKENTKVSVGVRRLYFDVLPIAIVGGGIAGIRTAEKLLETAPEQSVVLLEARDYLGGRARTIKWEGLDIDLGCQFLQDAETNPLVPLAGQYGHSAFWHKQVTAIRVPLEDEVVTEEHPLWREAESHGEGIRSKADESVRQAFDRKVKAYCEDQVRDEDKTELEANLKNELEQLAQSLAKEHDFVQRYRKQVSDKVDELRECAEQARSELDGFVLPEQPKDMKSEEFKIYRNKRTEQSRLQSRVKEFDKFREQHEAFQSDAWLENKGGVQTSLLELARKDIKEKHHKRLEEEIRRGQEETFAQRVEERIQKLLENPLLTLALAMSAELDEGIEPTDFTSYEADEEEEEEEEAKEDVGTSNRMSREGYGALIEKHARALNKENPTYLSVRLECPVTEITVGRSEVEVPSNVQVTTYARLETGQGVLYARGVVVCVPTEIVLRNAIKFTPALPENIREAFAAVPMGHYKKIFLPLKAESPLATALESLVEDATVPPEGETDPSLFTLSASGVPWKFLYRRALNVVVGFVGGAYAKELDQRDDQETATVALQVLAAALKLKEGDVLESWSGKIHTSRWSEDIYSRGAYSYTRPDGGEKRKTLREAVVHGCIVFAGEALRSSKEEYATAHGAWLSGEYAADWILRNLEK
ncbi:FAD-dependent oxidoreductase [Archangium violaceum]|uniref:flavin monoamine oxidase family protein n=1 Tax=Archangium violaceum TaxID=83451 RepID=UPI00193C74CA|nr:FAD-dependent oxidoreductase [Archangium violaceum]QRK12700.1 FAD-dependent oxidoreductase [Archangium violaceum]